MELADPESQGGIHHLIGREASLSHQEPVLTGDTWAIADPGHPSSALTGSGNPDEDWTKIADLTERRRIQNRIAQRNYRKKTKQRLEDLEKRAGADGNNVSETSSKKWAKSSILQRASSPPLEEYAIQQARTHTPTFRHDNLFFSSPSLPASSRPPFAPYQPTHSPPSDNGMITQPYENPQQRTVPSQDKQEPPLNKSLLSGLKSLRRSSISGSSSPPTGHASTQGTKTSMLRQQSSVENLGDGLALRLTDPESDEPSSEKRTQRKPATFQCTLCPKRFTRAYNLRSHLRIHTEERPFVCTVCGKAFARQHDMKRHEGLHSWEKRFVCKGDLKDGGYWGCGRRFARADALGRHFRSEGGRICIKPLLYEENLELERGKQRLSYQVATADVGLPAALLAQYPALATMNWAGDSDSAFGDSRLRYNSSDYESDDVGYASGTEFGFGDDQDGERASSFRQSRGAADQSQVLRPDTPQRVDNLVGMHSPQAFSHASSDQRHSTDTGISNPKHQSRGEESLRPEGNQNESHVRHHQAERENPGKAEVALQGITDSHHSDDDFSLRSFTESVFEMGSIVSSASSSHNNHDAMVSSFVDILVREPNMDSLLAITTSEFGVSSGRFTRNFSKLLKSYSRHLQQAVEGSSQGYCDKYLIAAKSVRSARHRVANLIASRYNERVPTAQDFKHREVELISRHLNRPVTTDIEDPSSNEEGRADEVDLMMGDMKQFLVSGEPFRLLKRNLRSLVIPDEFLYYIYESVREFLNLVLADTRPRSFARGLLHAIAAGRDIASDLNLQVRLMAAELKTESMEVSQLDASIFLETYSHYISVVAIDQVKDSFTTPSRSTQGSSPIHGSGSDQNFAGLNSKSPMERKSKPLIPHEDVLEQVVADTLPSVLYVDLVPHRAFLAATAAFASFINSLRDLVYPTFASEATRSVKATIRSAEISEDRLLALEGRRLLPILAEMQSCLTQSNTPLSFSKAPEGKHATALDRLKIAIEASTAAEWDWWPLQPPNRSQNPGRAKISWQCSCGVKRHETTSPYYASKLEGVFNKFPLAPDGMSGPTDRPRRSLSNASSQGARSIQSVESSSTNTSGGKSASSLPSSANSAITFPDDGNDSVVNFGTGTRRYIYVFLLVKATEYTLDTIDVSSMKARDFFQALRAAYNRHRGLWRRSFSVFVYNHCDFIKIIKPEPDTFMPGELKFELPPDHDDEYRYRPRPIYSAPITKHMFRHYFYGCFSSTTLRHRLHAGLPLAPRCRVRNPAAELLDHFPKRDRSVAAAAQSEKVEVCYGLAARECRSFFRVMVYLCVIMVPAFWFVFAWLFMWGNRGDLQDATVPMTLVLALLSMLWAVVYSGSDVRKDYGDALN